MHSQDGAIARNVRLYPLYTGAGRFHCSAAVFYLFFGEFLTLEGLLQLEAIYYVAYVLLEVPSGYFSDRVGRKPTLVISASALVLSFLLFSIGSTFAIFALAQILNAVGWTLSIRYRYHAALRLSRIAGQGTRVRRPRGHRRAERSRRSRHRSGRRWGARHDRAPSGLRGDISRHVCSPYPGSVHAGAAGPRDRPRAGTELCAPAPRVRRTAPPPGAGLALRILRRDVRAPARAVHVLSALHRCPARRKSRPRRSWLDYTLRWRC